MNLLKNQRLEYLQMTIIFQETSSLKIFCVQIQSQFRMKSDDCYYDYDCFKEREELDVVTGFLFSR